MTISKVIMADYGYDSPTDDRGVRFTDILGTPIFCPRDAQIWNALDLIEGCLQDIEDTRNASRGESLPTGDTGVSLVPI